MYIANAPKYTIDSVVPDEAQTAFNVVFMPVFIIALLATFIFQPFLKKMGELWAQNQVKRLCKSVVKLTVMVVIIDVVVTIVGSFIGGSILGWVYKIDLGSYNKELIVFMIAGGVIALQNLFIMVITTVRYQKYMLYGYVVTALIMLFAGKKVLLAYGMLELSIFFLGVLCLLTIYCVALILVAIVKNRRQRG